MATQGAQKYDVTMYDSDEQREMYPNGQPSENLFAAAALVQRILRSNGIESVLMGGFAMICRSSQRTTLDVDMIVRANYTAIWRIIEAQPRLIVPNSRLASGVLKIFVLTGPEYGDHACVISTKVEVDLVFPPSKGTPREERLDSHIEAVTVEVRRKRYTFNALDIQYMMQTKLWHCERRDEDRDLQDIILLLEKKPVEVHNIADSLTSDGKQAFFEKERISRLKGSKLAEYRRILKMA